MSNSTSFAMESGEFHMSVPHKRCETCAHWVRITAGSLVGGCHNDKNRDDLNDQVRRVVAFTTDLQLCSGWKPKEE